MNKRYCVPLSLDIYPLNAPIETYITGNHDKLTISDVNPLFNDFLKSLGLYIQTIHLFYKKASSYQRQPHVDFIPGINYKTGGDFARLNFVYKGKNSRMLWFKINDNVVPTEARSEGSIKYFQYKFNDLKLAEIADMKQPCIVQVGQPHSIINPLEERYCLSMNLTKPDFKKDQVLTMDEMVEVFKDYIPIT